MPLTVTPTVAWLTAGGGSAARGDGERWQATGPGGALFPALDADITLTPSGDQVTLLVLDGVYRPPLGTLGAGLDRAIIYGEGRPARLYCTGV